MANQQLIDYIRQQIAAGFPQEDIKKALLVAGWQAGDVEEGFASFSGTPTQPARLTEPQIVSAQPTGPAQPIGQAQSTVQASQPQAAKAQPVQEKPLSFESPTVLNASLATAEVPAKKTSRKLIIIISLAAVAALGLGIGIWYFFVKSAPVTQAPTGENLPVAPTSTLPATIKPLDISQIKNAKYMEDGKEIQLKDGYFEGDITAPASATSTGVTSTSKTGMPVPVTTTISFYKAAFGDLNGDGNDDAILVLTRNDGGTGNFRNLVAFLNDNGQPKFADLKALGDRVMIESFSIESGTITAKMVIQGTNDPMCCPTQKVTKKFKLVEGKIAEQESVLGWRVFSKTHVANFEGTSTLTYEFSYPDDGFSVKAETQNRIIITDKKTSKNNILTITYEGGRGFTVDDYWNQVLKKSCAGCSAASSTTGSITTVSTSTSATSTPVTSILSIAGSRNILVAENKTVKWVIWDSPSDAARLFIAQLPKPTEAIEKVLATFKFTGQTDSGPVLNQNSTSTP